MKITITPVAKPDMSKVAGEEALRGRACVEVDPGLVELEVAVPRSAPASR